jgi:hypothetical protein
MKTLLTTLFCAVLFVNSSQAQQVLSNGSFDSICVCAIDRIWEWGTSDVVQFSNDTATPFTPGQALIGDIHWSMFTVQINYDPFDIPHAQNSLILRSFPSRKYPNGAPFKSFIVNGTQMFADSAGKIDFTKSGEPYLPTAPTTFMTGLKGEYKFQNFTNNAVDYGKIKFIFKKFDALNNTFDTLAYGESTTQLDTTSTWQYFNIPFTFASNIIPDSVVVIVESSTNGMDSTAFWIDNLEFEWNTIGIEDINQTRIFAYPNPTNGAVQIQTQNNAFKNYEIINAQGQVIKRVSGQTFSLEDQPEGIYYIINADQLKPNTIKVLKVNE